MADYILEMRDITKTFPGVKALDNVSFYVAPGEIHALVGENGAGKTTLMNILDGVLQPNSGTIFVDGKEQVFKNPKDAQAHGISLIHQEFNLVNTLSIAENIYLSELQKLPIGLVDWHQVRTSASDLITELGFSFNVRQRVENLSVAEKQLVEIAKALSVKAKIIAMDEPTSSLTTKEIEKLFNIIRNLKQQGITIIYICHKLEEVFEISDTITVMRDGRIIDTKPTVETNNAEVISKMVGRVVEMNFPKRQRCVTDEIVLQAEKVCCASYVKDVSFTLHKGEILGIAGLVGSGRTELVEAIFGARPLQSGAVSIHGKRVRIRNTAQGKACSMGLVTEDRKETGLALHYTVCDNVVITNLSRVSTNGFFQRKKAQTYVSELVDELDIRTPSINQIVLNLSGGNQQKVVLAKWLFSNVDILILDEPTRGIDVGAKYEIYLLMNSLVAEGKSIIMISSELPEVLGMSDRVIVINGGRKKGELTGDNMNAEAVMHMALL